MSISTEIDNGWTGFVKIGDTEYSVGCRKRGLRVEIAYFGPAPIRMPLTCDLDGVTMRIVEKVPSDKGWTVLMIAPKTNVQSPPIS